MKVKLSVTGLNQIDDVVKKLPLALSHSVLSSAHAEAAKPLVLAEQLLAPEGPTGNLVDSIGVVRTSVKKANHVGEVKVGPRRRGRYRGGHAHLVEYGTKERRLLGRGKYAAGTNRGKMTKEPFAERAFSQTKDTVEGRIAKAIAKHVIRVMKRYVKR
jgi:hypothetical protein